MNIRNLLIRVKANKNGHKPINSQIVVERTRKRIFRHVPERMIPFASIPRESHFGKIHTLGLNLKGQFWPILQPAETIDGDLPPDFYIAKNCAQEVEEVFGLSIPMLEKIKIGVFVGLCIAIVLIIFLIVASTPAQIPTI